MIQGQSTYRPPLLTSNYRFENWFNNQFGDFWLLNNSCLHRRSARICFACKGQSIPKWIFGMYPQFFQNMLEVEFVPLFIGRNVDLIKSFWLCLTFNYLSQHLEINSLLIYVFCTSCLAIVKLFFFLDLQNWQNNFMFKTCTKNVKQ